MPFCVKSVRHENKCSHCSHPGKRRENVGLYKNDYVRLRTTDTKTCNIGPIVAAGARRRLYPIAKNTAANSLLHCVLRRSYITQIVFYNSCSSRSMWNYFKFVKITAMLHTDRIENELGKFANGFHKYKIGCRLLDNLFEIIDVSDGEKFAVI